MTCRCTDCEVLVEALEEIKANPPNVVDVAATALREWRKRTTPQVPPATRSRWWGMQQTIDGDEVPHEDVVRHPAD